MPRARGLRLRFHPKHQALVDCWGTRSLYGSALHPCPSSAPARKLLLKQVKLEVFCSKTFIMDTPQTCIQKKSRFDPALNFNTYTRPVVHWGTLLNSQSSGKIIKSWKMWQQEQMFEEIHKHSPFSLPRISVHLPRPSSSCSSEQRGFGSAGLSGPSGILILTSLREALSAVPAELDRPRLNTSALKHEPILTSSTLPEVLSFQQKWMRESSVCWMYTRPFLLSGVTVLPFRDIFPARNSTRYLLEEPREPGTRLGNNAPEDILERESTVEVMRNLPQFSLLNINFQSLSSELHKRNPSDCLQNFRAIQTRREKAEPRVKTGRSTDLH